MVWVDDEINLGPPYFDVILNKSVDDLELSVRSSNCLRTEGIKYVGDLVRRNPAEMLRIPFFGKKSFNEISEILAGLSLSFGMDINSEVIADRRAKNAEGHVVERLRAIRQELVDLVNRIDAITHDTLRSIPGQ